jgi:VanZ family protein
MQKHMKCLLKDKTLLIAIFVTISILYLSLTKVPKYNVTISHLDKWQHGIAYFTLTFFWLFTFHKKKKKYPIALYCILFGIIIEVLQFTITNYRTGDYFDVIANSGGVMLGSLVFNQLFKKNSLKKQKDL